MSDKYETSDPDAVLDGELDPFVEAYLRWLEKSEIRNPKSEINSNVLKFKNLVLEIVSNFDIRISNLYACYLAKES